jgi:phage terminase Nu1 subunit (DNA packaging protein)
MATQLEIAKFVGVAVRTWTDIANKLDIPTGSTIEFAAKAYITHLREVAAGRVSEDGYDLTAERARLSHHQANCEELKERQLTGELIPAEEVKADWADMILAFRAKVLALPGKVASVAMAAESVREVEEFVEEELHGALNELIETDKSGGNGAMPTATKTNRKPVGRPASSTLS